MNKREIISKVTSLLRFVLPFGTRTNGTLGLEPVLNRMPVGYARRTISADLHRGRRAFVPSARLALVLIFANAVTYSWSRIGDVMIARIRR